MCERSQAAHHIQGERKVIGAEQTFFGFQSTHPMRGGTSVSPLQKKAIRISIHPPHAGWDSKSSQNSP